jgi:hypothetical protein
MIRSLVLLRALSKVHQTKNALTDVHSVLKTMASLSQSEASMRSKSVSETCSGVSSFDKVGHDYFDKIRLRTNEGKQPCQINRLESISKRLLTSLENLGVHKDCVITTRRLISRRQAAMKTYSKWQPP